MRRFKNEWKGDQLGIYYIVQLRVDNSLVRTVVVEIKRCD